MVEDGGNPKKAGTSTVSVEVSRNRFAPDFQPNSYQETILETQKYGEPFLTVNANDGDTRVSNFIFSSPSF